ncbi:hypothetical protein Aau02nite_55550 [Amorphoplanes auranticolor]|uniref:Uncharacterized protein n=1 Tax=Actinoplanes auranticolor TaxID=47988 RepID=A0A919SKI2_9ACTN|nr:hypothetical protein Aau02nite_55550 [Actinoplanes auranticolor]
MPPVCTAGMARLRRTVTLRTLPTAVTVRTGGMRAIIGAAVTGSGTSRPLIDCPDATVSRLPCSPSWSIRVEVAGRFVGRRHRRPAHDGTGDRDPLPFAAGQLSRAVPDPAGRPDSA